jgi:signal transduction histidine kinase/ActR/RegA family two-component response regulator
VIPSPLSGFGAALDGVALEARRLSPARVLTAVAMAPLFWLILGGPAALGWAGAVALAEAAVWLSTTAHAAGRPIGGGRRAAYVAASLTGNAAWLGLAAAFWLSPRQGMSFFAMLVWACLVMNSVSFAYRSRAALALFGIPTALGMVATSLVWPRFSGAEQVLVLLGQAVLIGYAAVCAWRNVRAAEEMTRARAEAVAASQAKSEFLAMMSHELRTPMNGVLGMAHALKLTGLDARQDDYVRTLLRSGDGLMTILDDVLDLSKIEAGRFETEVAAFDLHELLLGVRDLWAARASEKGLKFALAVDEATPRYVGGDAARVRQILLNLISNAIKFTAEGEVRLTVRPTGAGGEVAFAVSDTGAGIEPAAQARLFQSFAQADATIARRFGGTGLGLAISRNLARLMGGDIGLQSRPGEGSCFTLTLPLPPMLPPPPPRPQAFAGEGAPLRVLAVDDNPTNLTVARALLESLGCTVLAAGGGAAALDIAGGEPLDLVLMDIQMPEMDGYETLSRLRALPAPVGALPVVALTANAMAGERERLLAAGFDDYLSKPLSPAALVRVIGERAGAAVD